MANAWSQLPSLVLDPRHSPSTLLLLDLANSVLAIGTSVLGLPMRLLHSFDFWTSTQFWVWVFLVVSIHRYLRLIVHCFSHWLYKSTPLPDNPVHKCEDATVVIPTIHDNPEELKPSLESILACNPACLILVTPYNKVKALQKVADGLSSPNVKVLQTSIANKRLQICEAIPLARTKITILTDDDVTWPSTMLPHLLAPFDKDAQIGGVGTCQRVKRVRDGSFMTRIWNWLGAAYIERRNFEISATHNIDGGTSCMSGRTAAYRTEVLNDPFFMEGFKTEKWGDKILNTDDDNFVTRWLVGHRWKTTVQYRPECELETTLENDHKFLYQCTRWARSNWRSNYTSLFRERYVWKRQPWCTYALHIATFTSLAIVFDPLILVSCWWATADWDTPHRRFAFWALFTFMFGFTKTVKLLGLFRRNPGDIVFWPVSVFFGYVHSLIKLYALFTLSATTWGSRSDGDANNESRLQEKPRPSEYLQTPVEPVYLGSSECRRKGQRPQNGNRDNRSSETHGRALCNAKTSHVV
ncbi:Glycosyl transferase, family 2 [Metarhizium album ARSEF 1941]|uniref:Glycosyl transferase, family 2 n=1 Tax=Metarhizium album (strain ARSEF 1941) TaxID=1081103 RepID=A0A0B2WKT8_METAS|nr:Glycosyl transferase, family 2 [Metarhizium album ARSEF 1941]KHN94249.1 Glycosyl transferase, family 2 [Metarhizium album ARSEF 1941]